MRTIWQRLLDRLAAGDATICADEVRQWDQVEWRGALALGLLREMELADSVICDQCGDAHWAGIFWITPGVKACFGCETGGVIDIEIDRLRQWRLDTTRIAKLAADALGLSSPIEQLLGGRLWHIGRKRLGGRYRDIFFVLGAGSPVAEMSAGIRASIGQGSALLLTVGCNGNPGGLPSGHHLLDFASVSHVEGGRVVVDLEYVEDRFTENAPSPRKPSSSIAVRAGATWRDVSITVLDGMLQVAVRGEVHEKGFAEIGVDQQSQPIQLLKLFAAARGALDAGKIEGLLAGDSPVKLRVLRLRQLLQELIEIDGDPISNNKKAKTYTCRFAIRLAGDDGFRTPAGTTWLDFAFHERADGRILVSVPELQKFRARAGQRDSGRSIGEVAEVGGTVARTHSLEEIELRTDTGRLTEEGTAFLELLRAGGILPRRSNDMIVLKLAKRLKEWTGLAGEPLRLVEATNSWTAAFASSSDIKKA